MWQVKFFHSQKVRKIEQLQKDKDKRVRHTHFKKEKVAYVEEVQIKEEDNEVHLIKLKPNLPYTYALLKKNVQKQDAMDHVNKKVYSFDITKDYQIFDMLLKDK